MITRNCELFNEFEVSPTRGVTGDFVNYIESFCNFGTSTKQSYIYVGKEPIPVYTNEFWTSKQRAAHSLHEISYRACFKPQLPHFFIDKLTVEGDVIFDPFMGRGTTLLEGVLSGRNVVGCDVNPLSKIIIEPRLTPPSIKLIEDRIYNIDLKWKKEIPDELLTFYHRDTLKELCALKNYFEVKGSKIDIIDKWIKMVATNRLTGHSSGFFSVYTLPPNQAVTVKRQIIINSQRNQIPEYRDVKKIIIKKSKTLLSDINKKDIEMFNKYGAKAKIVIGSSDKIKGICANSVSLVVTSPPFLNIVDYATDNWLRCWFNSIDSDSIPIWIFKKVEEWKHAMTSAFIKMHDLLKTNGYVAFEVGEVRNGKVKLEDYVIPAAEAAGLVPLLVLINDQEFTKTSKCWGVDNLQKGTNTNRIILLKKP